MGKLAEIWEDIVRGYYSLRSELLAKKSKDSSVTQRAPLEFVVKQEPKSIFAGREYHDSGYQIDDLIEMQNDDRETPLYMQTHGGHFELDNLMPDGRFNFQNFGEMANTFFRYYVGGTFFDGSEIPDVEIPGPDYGAKVKNGDMFIRRFAPVDMLYTLGANGFFDHLEHNFETVLTMSQHNGYITPSMADALKSAHQEYLKEEKLMEMFEILPEQDLDRPC